MTEKKPKEMRRQELLEAALVCFSKKGYHGTTIDDITREAGITKGGLYWHFKSKWDIFRAILDEHKKQEDAVWKKLEKYDISENMLIEGGLLFIKLHLHNKWILNIFSEIEVEAMRNKEVMKEYFSHFKNENEKITDLIKEAYKRGRIRKLDFNTFSLMVHIFAMGLVKHYLIKEKDLDYEKIWRVFSDAVLNGILVKEE
jgi:AcrR family transcriptional regulator